MKDFLKYFLASLLAIIVSTVVVMLISFVFFGVAVSSLTTSNTKTVSNNSILKIDLSQPIAEIGHEDFSTLISGGRANSGLIDILNAIDNAKKDNNIKGIYIKASTGAKPGMSSLQELRDAIKDFKSSGKFVVAYSDVIDQTSYYIASVANEIYISPLGVVELKGLATNLAFFKGTLDKLGVKPEIFYVGKYKSATEPFRTDKMSEANRVQIAALQDDIWRTMMNAISEKSGMDSTAIMTVVNDLKIQNANDALLYKLVDGIKYKDEVESILRKKIGIKDDADLELMSMADYANTLSNGNSTDKVAVLVGEGQIVDGQGTNSLYEIAGDKFIEEIRKVKDNEDIKAVVLRINSPGGSALASENILRELELLHVKKPIVVSMSDVAASGGYYIACKADSIFATENTITGSIGIFGVLMNAENAMKDKIGITFDVQKNAPYADFPNIFKSFSDREKQYIQTSLDTMYYIFKNHVATGRKLSMEQVEEVAQGRVWTGTDALSVGLVDAIGGLDRAIVSAAHIAKLKDYSVRIYPSSINQLEDLLKNISGQDKKSVLVEQWIQSQFTQEYQYYQMMAAFKKNKSYAWAYMPYNISFY